MWVGVEGLAGSCYATDVLSWWCFWRINLIEEPANENKGCVWCGKERIVAKLKRLCQTCARIESEHRRISNLIIKEEHVFAKRDNQIRLQYYMDLESQQRALGERKNELRKHPEGIAVENLFREVAELAGCPWQMFHGLAGTFDHEFKPDQRRLLISLLLDVIQYGGASNRRRKSRLHVVLHR